MDKLNTQSSSTEVKPFIVEVKVNADRDTKSIRFRFATEDEAEVAVEKIIKEGIRTYPSKEKRITLLFTPASILSIKVQDLRNKDDNRLS